MTKLEDSLMAVEVDELKKRVVTLEHEQSLSDWLVIRLDQTVSALEKRFKMQEGTVAVILSRWEHQLHRLSALEKREAEWETAEQQLKLRVAFLERRIEYVDPPTDFVGPKWTVDFNDYGGLVSIGSDGRGFYIQALTGGLWRSVTPIDTCVFPHKVDALNQAEADYQEWYSRQDNTQQ